MQGCHMEGGAIWVFSCFNPHFRVKVTHRAKLHLPTSIKLISRGVWLYWKPADFWVRVAHGPGAQCAVPINTGSKPSASGARCQNPPLQNALTSFTAQQRNRVNKGSRSPRMYLSGRGASQMSLFVPLKSQKASPPLSTEHSAAPASFSLSLLTSSKWTD